MIRDPSPPEPVTQATQAQARINAALALADKGISFTDALVLLDRAPDSAERLGDLGTMTLSELCDDQDRFNDVVTAIMAERRCTYFAAQDFLLERHAAAGERREPRHVTPGEGLQPQEVTLAACLEGSGVSVGRVMLLAAEHEAARTLAAPSKGMTKRPVDEWGEALRDLGEDLDALLADDTAAIRDFRKARDAGLIADDGIAEPLESEEWPSWRSAWRSAVNQGRDLLQTLSLRDEERAAELERQRQVGEIERRVQNERLDAARKQRQLAADLVEQARRLEAA